MNIKNFLLGAVIIFLFLPLVNKAQTPVKFAFGWGKAVKDFTQVQASDFYTKEKATVLNMARKLNVRTKTAKLRQDFAHRTNRSIFRRQFPKEIIKLP